MKILVATKEIQGQRENDFFWTKENEILMDSFECERDEAEDGSCGCRRSLVGVETKRATTTFKVTESDLNKSEIIKLFSKSFEEAFPSVNLSQEAEDSANYILEIAEKFEVEEILEKRGRVIQKREIKK